MTAMYYILQRSHIFQRPVTIQHCKTVKWC